MLIPPFLLYILAMSRFVLQTGQDRSVGAYAVKRLPQNQLAYEQLKSAIITLRLPPGSYLNETAICIELGLSRTPVHHALHRLMHEGLVSIVPRKGVLVQPLSINDFLELMVVRRLNDPVSASLAAERITPAELQQLNVIIANIHEAKRNDVASLITLDRRFHAIITDATRNRVLVQLLDSVHDRSARFWAMALASGSWVDEILQEYSVITEQLHRHDARGAMAAMEAHIDSFSRTLSTLAEHG